MSARAELVRFLSFGPCTQTDADQLLDAYRVEVLTKAGVEYEDCDVCGAARSVGKPCHHCAFKVRMAAEAGQLGTAPTAAAPDFFQPGRTYTFGQWGHTPGLFTHTTRTMTVTHIETSPDGSKRVALGWEYVDDKPWLIGVEDMDGWTLVGGEGQ